MDRRTFFKGSAALSAGVAAFGGGTGWAAESATTADAQWQVFEITYNIALAAAKSPARLWVPLPQDALDYQRVMDATWSATVPGQIAWDGESRAPIFRANWADGTPPGEVQIVVRAATRDRSGAYPWASYDDLVAYLKPTPSSPTDGIVAEKAKMIVGDKTAPLDKARAIYDWVVDNTFRNPKTRGCGLGDVKFMLESGDLGGKCADINSLYVALARASGLPARDIFGIRVAPSKISKSLGKADDITSAQHCRAEVFIEGQGWFPVDPADVRKIVLEEEIPLDHAHAKAIRERLFGNWEMNWVAFNYARDIKLPGQQGDPLSFLMYPYAETPDGPLNSLDPAAFKYTIASRRLEI